MSLKDEIIPYLQSTGLVSNIVSTRQARTTDNGPLFTSELYILLALRSELKPVIDRFNYYSLIRTCIGTDGELHRAPGDNSPDETDNHHGAYAAHIVLGLRPQFKLPFRLWRQPQLIALAAIGTKSVPIRIIGTPFIVYAALVIATSCIGVDASDSTSRILAWLLIKGTESSVLCRLASILWKRRLMATYDNGMQTVFQIFFGVHHPLAQHMVKF